MSLQHVPRAIVQKRSIRPTGSSLVTLVINPSPFQRPSTTRRLITEFANDISSKSDVYPVTIETLIFDIKTSM